MRTHMCKLKNCPDVPLEYAGFAFVPSSSFADTPALDLAERSVLQGSAASTGR
jgi:Cu2+-containing amine oxidase